MGTLLLSVYLFCTFPNVYEYTFPVPCIAWDHITFEDASEDSPWSKLYSINSDNVYGKQITGLTGFGEKILLYPGKLANDSTSIWFPEGSYIPKTLPTIKSSSVYLHGYASPDGKNPEMQKDLAWHRAQVINKYLLSQGISIRGVKASVCTQNIPRDSCWRVDVIGESDEY